MKSFLLVVALATSAGTLTAPAVAFSPNADSKEEPRKSCKKIYDTGTRLRWTTVCKNDTSDNREAQQRLEEAIRLARDIKSN